MNYSWLKDHPGTVGEGLLHEDPRSSSLLRELGEDLSDLVARDCSRFLRDICYPFAAWVADLPASERHHHRGRFGLLEHSLDVARRFVRAIARGTPGKEPGLHPRLLEENADWYRVGTALALFHDFGKVRHFIVRAPSGATWSPLETPLAHFRISEGLPPWGPSDFQWIPRRGLEPHNRYLIDLVSGVLTDDDMPGFMNLFDLALRAWGERNPEDRNAYPHPYPYLAVRVQRADQASARGCAERGGWGGSGE